MPRNTVFAFSKKHFVYAGKDRCVLSLPSVLFFLCSLIRKNREEILNNVRVCVVLSLFVCVSHLHPVPHFYKCTGRVEGSSSTRIQVGAVVVVHNLHIVHAVRLKYRDRYTASVNQWKKLFERQTFMMISIVPQLIQDQPKPGLFVCLSLSPWFGFSYGHSSHSFSHPVLLVTTRPSPQLHLRHTVVVAFVSWHYTHGYCVCMHVCVLVHWVYMVKWS